MWYNIYNNGKECITMAQYKVIYIGKEGRGARFFVTFAEAMAFIKRNASHLGACCVYDGEKLRFKRGRI